MPRIAKFTPAGISGHTLWFLVCHTGHDISALANHLVTAGVDNVTIYLPKDFMYVSRTGIPHVLLTRCRRGVDAACDLHDLFRSNCNARRLRASMTDAPQALMTQMLSQHRSH